MPNMELLYCFCYIYLFLGLKVLVSTLTGVFNGDVSFLYFMYLILYSFTTSSPFYFWFKRQKIATHSNRQKWKWSYLNYFVWCFFGSFFERWVLQTFQICLFLSFIKLNCHPLFIPKWAWYFGYSVFVLATVTSPMIEEFILEVI